MTWLPIAHVVHHRSTAVYMNELSMCRVVYLSYVGVLRRVHKYPVYTGESGRDSLYSWFNGRHHTDEICVRSGLSAHQLDTKLEADPNIIVLWK